MQISTDILAAQPFLKGLSTQQLELLLESAISVEFKEGELIFEEGSPANRFYLLLSGEVALESPSEERYDERGPIPIETIGAGSMLGWSWLFPPYSMHFSARALEPTTTIFFYGTRLREQCEQDHELGYQLIKRIAEVATQSLRATQRRLMKYIDKNTPEKP